MMIRRAGQLRISGPAAEDPCRQVPSGGQIDDTHGPALAHELLYQPPGLSRMHVEFAGLTELVQNTAGQFANLVGQAH